MDKLIMGVGKRIAECRKEKGFMQKDLCNLIDDLTPQMISNWEQGHACPSPYYLCILAKTLDTTTDYLLMGIKNNVLEEKPSKRHVLETIVSFRLSGSKDVKVCIDKDTLHRYLHVDIRENDIVDFWLKFEKLNEARSVLGEQVYFEQVYKLLDLCSK